MHFIRTAAVSIAALGATVGSLALISLPVLPGVQDPVKAATSKPDQEPQGKLGDPDVETVDGLVDALYGVISGGKGQARDWDRMRKLFHPQGRMVTLSSPRPGRAGGAGALVRTISVDDYIEQAGGFLVKNGFFEREVERKTQSSKAGDHVQLWSRYEGRHAEEDEKPFLTGANGITLVRQDGRWWILQIIWQQDS